MSDKSDFSGHPIGGDAEATIEVQLDKGRRRRLAVTRAELEGFATMGKEIGTPFDLWRDRVFSAAPKVFTWAAAAAAAAGISGWVAKVYSDRQQAQDIKSALISQLSKGVVKLNGGAELVATDGLGKPDAKLLRRRDQLKFAWQRDSAQIDPVLHTHFEDQGKAIGSWVEYEAILSDYAELACCTSAKTRTELVQDVRAFFTRIKSRDRLPHPTSSDPWTVLRCAGQSCTQTRQWRVNYHWLGRRLLRSRGELARYLLDAHASNLG